MMTMQNRRKRAILTCASLLITLMMTTTGCATQTSVTNTSNTTAPPTVSTQIRPTHNIVFTNNCTVAFPEPYPYSGPPKRTVVGKSAQHSGVTYLFDSGITEESCIEIIGQIASAINLIEASTGAVTEACEVYILNENYLPRVYEHQLYIGKENFGTQEYIIGLIQMLYGYELNYGLAYALSCDIAPALDIQSDSSTISLSEALELCKSAPEYLDLNYACFSNQYADETQLMYVKALAGFFYEYLSKEAKLHIFSEYSDSLYCSYLTDFLQANNLPAYSNADLAGTIFFNGGSKVQMAWKNHIADFFIEEGYAVTYQDAIFSEDMTSSGYSNLRRIVVDYIAQAEYMQGILQDYGLNQNHLDVLFMQDKVNAANAAGLYFPRENKIRLFAVSAFMHEYTHYLVNGYMTGWKWEVLPTYYTNYPVNEHITYQWYADMISHTALDPHDPKDAEKYEFDQRIYASMDHEFDWASMDDFQYLLDAYIVKRGWQHKITDVYSGVSTKSSFFHYLCKQKSEEAALAAFMNNAPDVYFDATWEELIDLWKEYLDNRFAWVNQ